MPADAKFPMVREVRYAGVEAGGTTWVVAIAAGDPTRVVERASFATGDRPDAVLAQVVAWLAAREFDTLGVASFGPIDLHRHTSPRYGYITTTPKPGWRDTDVLGPLRRGLNLPDHFPLAFDTDVNAPALAEFMAARADGYDLSSCAYVTVGTGIGVGLVINGAPLRGMLHGEGGHVSVPRLAGDDGVAGTNGAGVGAYPASTWACAEAMCNSAALARRAGCSVHELAALPDDHPVGARVAAARSLAGRGCGAERPLPPPLSLAPLRRSGTSPRTTSERCARTSCCSSRPSASRSAAACCCARASSTRRARETERTVFPPPPPPPLSPRPERALPL